MAEISEYEERIIYLATVFRAEMSKKDNFIHENPEKPVCKRKKSRRISMEKFLSEISNFADEDDDDMEDGIQLPEMCEVDVTEWNKAFSELCPPPIATKRRQLHGGIKLTNKSCQEILQVVRSYKENLESKKECQNKSRNATLSNLWHTEKADVAEDSDDEDPEQNYPAHECNETPIPRNFTRFNR